MKLKRLWCKFLLTIAHLPFKSRGVRAHIVKWAGVNIVNPSSTFIGSNVGFDSLYPEDITIEEKVVITTGCEILSHFLDTQAKQFPVFKSGKVHIKKGAYLGAHSIICKPVIIGEGAVVGAGSIVTKDIPDNEIWAGNPARFIKKRLPVEQ